MATTVLSAHHIPQKMGPILNSLLILCIILTACQSTHLASRTKKKTAWNFTPVSSLFLYEEENLNMLLCCSKCLPLP